MPKKTQRGTRGQPEESRRSILQAAIGEFGSHGLAGARTAAIAKAAGVNKALLYYYYRDKKALYDAVLDHVMAGRFRELSLVLDGDAEPGEKVLSYAVVHFNYMAKHAVHSRLMQEVSDSLRGNAQNLCAMIHRYFSALSEKLAAVLRAGIKSGQFRKIDVQNFSVSVAGLTVFYFSAIPVMRQVSNIDPLSPKALQQRREAILDLLGAALFTDRAHGMRVVRKILSSPLGSGGLATSMERGKHK